MQEEKSWVYTLILGVCMLLCLLLIGRMLLGGEQTPSAGEAAPPGDAAQEEGTQMRVTIDEQALRGQLVQLLGFEPEELTLSVSADRSISVRGVARRQELEDSGLLPGGLRTAMLFLPDSCGFSGVWSAALEDGQLALQCRRAEIAGIALPEEAAAALSALLGQAVNRQLERMQLAPQTLEWADGRLTLLP